MSATSRSVALLGVTLIVAVGAPHEALAIPAFARAYDVPCSTCHTLIPRRSEFGDVFRQNGYRWPGEADRDTHARKGPPLEMTGVSFLDGLLPTTLPFSALFSTAFSYAPQARDGEPSVSLGDPSFGLLFGSTFGEHLSMFGLWQGGGAPEQLYLHLAKIAGRPELNLRVGKLEQSTTLFQRNTSLAGPLLISSSTLTSHSVGRTRLGAEATGILFRRLFAAVGTVQNGGFNSDFDGYYHLSYKIGGMDLLGEEPDIDLDDPSWLEDIVLTIGHWGYLGRVSEPGGNKIGRVRRLGLDFKLRFWELTVWAGVMAGADVSRRIDAPNVTAFGEVSYAIASWLTGSYLYQYQDSATFERQFQRHDVAVLFLPIENMRLRARFTFTDDQLDNEIVDLHLMFAL